MGIIGHKERALLRRGHQVQEALKRRKVINEGAFLRRNLLTEEEKMEMDKLRRLCDKEVSKNIQDGIYCQLIEILNELPERSSFGELPKQKTHDAIKVIYNFFRPTKKDNRSLFSKTIKAVLKNENPSNALRLIARFLLDSSNSNDEVKKALLDFRKSKVAIPEDMLEDFLKKARFTEYTKYENSFLGDNFSNIKGKIKFDPAFTDPFWKVVLGVVEGAHDINTVINAVAQAVLSTDISKLLNKADLGVKTNLMVGDEVIIPKDGKVEVKKMDYELDSYFSEFYSIYKTTLPSVAYNPEFITTYNKIIDGVYEIVKKKGQSLIDNIISGFDAIMYDGNLLVLNKDIHLYWSNKGQRGCNEHRLSIRYKLKNPKIKAYVYDSMTHSNQLRPQEISINVTPEIVCSKIN